VRTSTWLGVIACAALAGTLSFAAAQEKPAPLWPQEGYSSLRAAAAEAKAGGKRLLLGLSGGDH